MEIRSGTMNKTVPEQEKTLNFGAQKVINFSTIGTNYYLLTAFCSWGKKINHKSIDFFFMSIFKFRVVLLTSFFFVFGMVLLVAYVTIWCWISIIPNMIETYQNRLLYLFLEKNFQFLFDILIIHDDHQLSIDKSNSIHQFFFLCILNYIINMSLGWSVWKQCKCVNKQSSANQTMAFIHLRKWIEERDMQISQKRKEWSNHWF